MRKNWLAWAYLAFAIPAILLLSTVMAPMQVADEFNHTLRADQISHGTMLQPIGGLVDNGLLIYGHWFDGIHFHPEQKVGSTLADRASHLDFHYGLQYENFQNTAQYGPVLYIPDALALLLARVADVTIAHAMLLARVLNGVVAAAIGYGALTLLRHGRPLAFAILLLPMSLTAFGSTSQDAPIIALSLLAVAIVSRAVAETRPLDLRELLAFVLIVLVTTMGRPSHFALLGLLFAPPGFLVAWRPKLIVLALTLAAIGIWIVTLRLWLMPPVAPGWSVNDQFRNILAHPLVLPAALVETFIRDSALWPSIIGRLGWYDTPMPGWFCGIGFVVLGCALLLGDNPKPYLRPALVAAVTGCGMALAVAAALYLSWTDVGAGQIGGLQGRYFLPVLPLLGWIIPSMQARPERLNTILWTAVLGFPALSICVMIRTIAYRYYGGFPEMLTATRLLLLPWR